MSKKWRTRGSTNTKSSATVWACGVCGSELTNAESKLSAKESTETHASLGSVDV